MPMKTKEMDIRYLKEMLGGTISENLEMDLQRMRLYGIRELHKLIAARIDLVYKMHHEEIAELKERLGRRD